MAVHWTLVIVILVAVHSAQALRCWKCSSDTNPRCADPFNSTARYFQTTDCERDRAFPGVNSFSGTPYCRKLRQKVNGELVVMRSCSWTTDGNLEEPCSSSSIPSYIKVESCDVCNTDGCNGASDLLPSILTGFLAFTAMLISRA